MDNNEVNKIIADYMGWELSEGRACVLLIIKDEIHNTSDLYTDSLDALVPVWETLQYDIQIETEFDDGFRGWGVCCLQRDYRVYSGTHRTIQEAAAHATARAIKELDRETKKETPDKA